ncbi:TetR/AcrR family transcriptional regulator [Paenibacillus sp. XY044]|uniref:TetR/AcrR family transcriptional regulator n=1 Tax=Paenibacillus sp. XY044 TaxID=2026089 RepID=UPI000B990574|nr:TetR/AcrR family transcriptional regulator [Paenibacillus sp. XY044]OZB98695.1 TetR family transcriptional regulator [Paenibacillus sp. XY044]
MMEKQKRTKRDAILAAASTIVRSQGVEKLTLDAAAKEAGVSKGGLLYHFPNKDALILGMIDHSSEGFWKEMSSRTEKDASEAGKWTRSYVDTTFNCYEEEQDMITVLSAAMFTNPEMLKKIQEMYAAVQQNLQEDGLGPVRSSIIRLAADGLWFAEMFGLAPPDDELKKQIFETLMKWTKENP